MKWIKIKALESDQVGSPSLVIFMTFNIHADLQSLPDQNPN